MKIDKIDKIDITYVTDNNLCFGCGACDVSCPVDCIDFHPTNAGRLVPIINYDTCTNCSICFDICPGIDSKENVLKELNEENFHGDVINAYMGKSTNKEIYENSQSGGMVTATLKYLFNEDLIKYALVVRMDYSVAPEPSYSFISSVDELFHSQKSIYAPINLVSALNDIKKIDGDIAIVGLPCHIEGVVSLANKRPRRYNKIKYKLGLICDGVLSLNASKYISSSTDEEHKIIYKDKENPNYLFSNMTLRDRDQNLLKVIDRDERFYLKELATPPRCNLCFNKMNIHSDLVFGDPWGIPGYDKEKGESIVVSRNHVGEDIIQGMLNKGQASLGKVSYKDILDGQAISRRIDKVYKSIEVYRSLGFDLPSYYKNSKKKIDKRFKSQEQIIAFLEMENKTETENLSYIRKTIRKKIIIVEIKKIIKKFLFVDFWRR